MAKQPRTARRAAPRGNEAAARKPVDSLADYVTATLRIRDDWWREDEAEAKESGEGDAERPPSDFWFRGQGSARWALTPRLYRPESRLKVEDEDEIRTDFKRRGRQLLTSEPNLPANEKEWYFLMQHYGAPTRLLDWTDGSLLGLYFALRSQDQNRPTDAAVWVLDPNWLNKVTTERIFGAQDYLEGVLLPEWKETDVWFPVPFEQAVLVDEPVAIDPPHVARRVAVQRSRFTIHGRDRRGLEKLARGATTASSRSSSRRGQSGRSCKTWRPAA